MSLVHHCCFVPVAAWPCVEGSSGNPRATRIYIHTPNFWWTTLPYAMA